jgi:hypothetical protein
MYAHFPPHFVIIRPGTNGNAFLQMHVSHMHLSRATPFPVPDQLTIAVQVPSAGSISVGLL